MAHAYSHLYGIRTRGLRLFTVYGPWGRPDMAPMLFTSAILKGQAIKVFNYGDMKRDFTFIDDVVISIVTVIEQKFESSSFRIYNIGNNSPVNLLDFIIAIEESLDITAKKEMLPLQNGDVKSTCAYIQDFIDDFGYIPTTGFKEGIGRFITWYKEFYDHSYSNRFFVRANSLLKFLLKLGELNFLKISSLRKIIYLGRIRLK